MILIGLGVSTVAGFVPRIVVFMVAKYELIYRYTNNVSLITILYFYTHFVNMTRHKNSEKCLIIYQYKKIPIYIMIILHAIILLATVLIGEIYFRNSKIRNCNLIYFVVCFATSMEFHGIWTSNFELLEQTTELQMVVTVPRVVSEPSTVVLERSSEDADPRLECKICMSEYNDTYRIPRILKECGHTICENCANQLLESKNGQFLLCPFCQKITVVRGPASLLAKNYAIIDII